MSQDSVPAGPPLESLDREQFVQLFGGIYEHSPWIAAAVWDAGLSAADRKLEALSRRFYEVLDAAPRDKKLELVRAHPDLAGRAAVTGELTPASTREQAKAGLDQCSPDEFQRFQSLNEAYKAKFGFPFIMAVRNSTRVQILDAFATRLENVPELEFERAIAEIHQIARLRLEALAAPESDAVP